MKIIRYTHWLNSEVTTVFAVECKGCNTYSKKFQNARNFFEEKHKLSGCLSLSGNMYLITNIPYSLKNKEIIDDLVKSLEDF
jgi:hypothetical protein